MIVSRLLRLIGTIALASAMLLSGTQIVSASGTVSRGDAEELLYAIMTGGRALRFIAGVTLAAPSDGWQRGLIFPPFADGHHYCADDWHVIAAGWFTGGDADFTYQDALPDLTGIIDKFVLDGTVVPIGETTPVTRRVNPLVYAVEFGFSEGTLMPPASIAVGKHKLVYTAVFPDGETLKITPTFYIDPSGSAACTG